MILAMAIIIYVIAACDVWYTPNGIHYVIHCIIGTQRYSQDWNRRIAQHQWNYYSTNSTGQPLFVLILHVY